MRFIEAWLGRYQYHRGGSSQNRIPSRVVTVSDIEEVQAELGKACDRVEVCRTAGGGHDISADIVPLTEPLVGSSDAVLRSLQVAAYVNGWQWPVVSLVAGADRPSQLVVDARGVNEARSGLEEEEIQRRRADVEQAAHRAWEVITGAGRRTLGPAQWRDVAQVLLGAVLLAVFIWFTMTVRNVPIILVGALASIASYATLRSWVFRRIERRYPIFAERLIVRPVTRPQWRQQRWSQKRDFKVGAVTFFVTVVATIVGTLLATDQWPGWLHL